MSPTCVSKLNYNNAWHRMQAFFLSTFRFLFVYSKNNPLIHKKVLTTGQVVCYINSCLVEVIDMAA